jgi:polyketide biosynthesis enoyl-CoA hydratase PksH
MTMTTLPINANEAYRVHLVDEVSDKPEEYIKQLCNRITRLEHTTIYNMKQYFKKMWIISDEMEKTAVAEATRLISNPKVKENISNFVKYMKFPWDSR